MVVMFEGYVRLPSILTSTLLRTGNLTGEKILYVMPFRNKIVEFVDMLLDANAAVKAGVSSCPSTCATSNVVHAET